MLLLPSAWLVRVPPRMALDMDFSAHWTIQSKGSWVPFAASLKSMAMPSGIIPAALWPMFTTARSRVAFSSGVAPDWYLPRRTGKP
ncbi:hypothetical protein D9M68_825800 [compost metagenome]